MHTAVVHRNDMRDHIEQALAGGTSSYDVDAITDELRSKLNRWTMTIPDELLWATAFRHVVEVEADPKTELIAKLRGLIMGEGRPEGARSILVAKSGDVTVSIEGARPDLDRPVGKVAIITFASRQDLTEPVTWDELWEKVEATRAALDTSRATYRLGVELAGRRVRELRENLTLAETGRDTSIVRAMSVGVPVDDLQSLTGLSRARLYQIRDRAITAEREAHDAARRAAIHEPAPDAELDMIWSTQPRETWPGTPEQQAALQARIDAGRSGRRRD